MRVMFFVPVKRWPGKEPAMHCDNCNIFFPRSLAPRPQQPPEARRLRPVTDFSAWPICYREVDSEFRFCPLCGCGSCGYELNLSSSSRNTATIGSKYGKSIKKGIISFFSIDESRFIQVEELKCVPYFISKRFWGLFRRRTKLLCRNCGNHIGNAYNDSSASYPLVTNESDFSSNSGSSSQRKYDINIRCLQPYSVHSPVHS